MSTQHISPCKDCPWRRKSFRGWLGASAFNQSQLATPQEWLQIAHSDTVVQCHIKTKHQCAGMAIYRDNVCKMARGGMLDLPGDKETVFATPMEFEAHHTREKK